MSDNLSIENLNALIIFQQKFRFLKKELEIYNARISFYKDILMSMINNLSFCNNLKMFQDTDSNYMSILNELKEIKDKLDEFHDFLTMKSLMKEGLNVISLKILKL